MNETTPTRPRAAASVLILRDGARGLEVAMVERAREIDFASGALVFPGGSVDEADGAGATGLRVAAIREAFEECGVLFARRGGTFASASDAARLRPKRAALEANEISMPDLARAEALDLAVDVVVPFARWITPPVMRKRFDTHFFAAPAPEDQPLDPDGAEAVAAHWLRPAEALEAADAGARAILFPTRLNLMMLAAAGSVDEALAAATARAPVAVEPKVEREPGGAVVMTLPEGAGYGARRWRMAALTARPEPLDQ